jgi:hypothetical protein
MKSRTPKKDIMALPKVLSQINQDPRSAETSLRRLGNGIVLQEDGELV